MRKAEETKDLLLFQSTLPEGSDKAATDASKKYTGISIHAPRRERRYAAKITHRVVPISIHAPRRERLRSDSRDK